jgi:hypothetical protein
MKVDVELNIFFCLVTINKFTLVQFFLYISENVTAFYSNLMEKLTIK